MSTKQKSFFIGMIIFLLSTATVSLIGYVFNISILTLAFEYQNNQDGVFISINQALPLLIGLLSSLIGEHLYRKTKEKKEKKSEIAL
ncbi:hypothetical protein [Rossellomorea marisflavi]|uniref:hypothetical protein n=1 Tax=Rossellomorea marisflavi TaxID=189381 RepID=UPI003F9EC9BC